MKRGYLSQFFKGIAAKQLRAVEADISASHQHEFNGVSSLKSLFGTERKTFDSVFIYLNDSDDDPPVEEGFVTWYDSRINQPKRSSEFRLFFKDTSVSACASAGDELFIGLRPDDTVLVIIAKHHSTVCNQLRWLFGIEEDSGSGFSVRDKLEGEQDRLNFASRLILENLGIEATDTDENYLDEMLQRFQGKYPSTKDFSEYARSTLTKISALDNPDSVLITWWEQEDILFRTFEKYLVENWLKHDFNFEVDSFISYSLSVQNRRKSRAGQAFENHLECIFSSRGISYTRTPITEGKSKPDFLFPGIEEYRDEAFPDADLTMLAAKTTCKDRWRQVLTEAERIPHKHLITLETSITRDQTDEMRRDNLQLVIPSVLHKTYEPSQQEWLMTLTDFIEMVQEHESSVLV